MTKRTLLLLAGGGVLTVVALIGLRQLARARTVQLFGRIVARVETVEPRIALTFDDGPQQAFVDSVLDLLAARRVRATFFVTGQGLARAPGAGRLLVAAGHELGNHSYTHKHMVLRSPGFVRKEIERTDSLIRAAGHRGPVYFRPPFGYKLAVLPWYLARTGRTSVTWDIEPESYPGVTVTNGRIVRHVLDRVRPGSIILLHIWHSSRATSLAAVGPLVDSLQARGYRVGTVRELLDTSVLEQHETDQDRYGGGNTKDEARARKDMATSGTGSFVSQVAQEGSIDEYQIVVNSLFLAMVGRCSKCQRSANADADKDADLRRLEGPDLLRAEDVITARVFPILTH